MRLITLVPTGTKFPFMHYRKIAALASLSACLLSIGLFLFKGLNYGIDFQGGILVEIRAQQAIDLAKLRSTLSGLSLGEVQLQEFGADNDVLIRVERQPGGEEGQRVAVKKVQDALGANIDYRRIEFVGPKVGGELIEAGVLAVIGALVAMLVYIWFRFEWQFGVGAVVALFHDVLLTIGIFSLLGLEFNLSTVAAILTIAGYSINDTVVVYDRVRENLRKYKKMEMIPLIDLSLNDTLSRTLLTSLTTLLAIVVLFLFGGEVIKGFSFAMMWGVIVGTYSSIFIALAMLLMMNPQRTGMLLDEEEETAPASPG